jgi:hypothetical protein
METRHVIYEHTFTPEEARGIVEATNPAGYNFRTVDSNLRAVKHLADSMKNGEWRWQEANPIRLSDDWSKASDGLHRLTACAMSGVPLRSLVLVGDQWRAGVNSDRGRARTLAQYFTFAGIPNATVKAAVTRAHVARVKAYQHGVTNSYANTVFVHDGELIEFAEKNDDDLSWIAGRSGLANAKGMNGTGYGTFLLEALAVDREMAADFHETFVGEVTSDTESDPIVRFRQFATRRYDSTGKRMTLEPTIRGMVKCWDLRERGEALRMWKQPTHDDVRFPAGYPVPNMTRATQ